MMTNEKNVEKRMDAATELGDNAATQAAKLAKYSSNSMYSLSNDISVRRKYTSTWDSQVTITSARRLAGEPDGPVPTAEEDGSTEDVEGDLDDEVGEDHDGPMVHPRRLLTGLEEGAEPDELGLESGEQVKSDPARRSLALLDGLTVD
jgi:hypothetical protein